MTPVTLVGGGPRPDSGTATGNADRLASLLKELSASATGPGAKTGAAAADPARAGLNKLPAEPDPSAANGRSKLDELMGGDGAGQGQTTPNGEPSGGAAEPMTRLARGERLSSTDFYTTASLPPVAPRPHPPPAGDLWRRVAPCWLPSSGAPATLVVSIDAEGRVIGLPLAVRTGSPKPAEFVAELAAARALQACAPYAGLRAGRWRVEFPGRG